MNNNGELWEIEDESTPTDQQEDLTDLKGTTDWTKGVALWSTDWTAETVIRQLQKGNINLNPNWQRRGAWRDDRQSKFIESLILGLPVPQIVLAETPDQRGRFIVIDGKQRLITLLRFGGGGDDGKFTPLTLVGLTDREDLNGKSLEELEEDPDHQEDVSRFENQSMRTVIIKNWTDEKYLYSVFLRINTGSVQLSPQELRQALSPGDFSNFVDAFSADSKSVQKMLGLRAPDFRMRDAEIVLRFIAYRFFVDDYSGNLKLFLDTATKSLNADWKAKKASIEEAATSLNDAIEFTFSIFEKGAMRKWNGEKFERPINRAVFDIMAYYFSSPAIRASLEGKGADIVAKFKSLCTDDREFLSSLESTTKSIDANAKRFETWGKALQEIAGIQLPIPSIKSA